MESQDGITTEETTAGTGAGVTEPGVTGATRSQNLVYILPHTTESLGQFLSPSLSRIDTGVTDTQLLIVTPDSESAVVISEAVLRSQGAQGIEVVPATSPGRAARLMDGRPARVVVGPPANLIALISWSALKTGTVRTIVLAWPEAILESQDDTAALETLMAEVKDAERVLVVRGETPAIEDFVERHMRRPRRINSPDNKPAQRGRAEEDAFNISYVPVVRSARPAALRRVLDELDPPSASVVVRSPESEAEAVQAVMNLGYRRADDPVKVVRAQEGIPASHAVIFYDTPVTKGELKMAAGAEAVQTIAFVQPSDLASLKALATVSPMESAGAVTRARHRDEAVRHELRQVLNAGIIGREAVALEPLLADYDGLEIAAAALKLLERERERQLTETRTRPPRQEDRPSGDRGSGDRRPPRTRDGERPSFRGEKGDRAPGRGRGDRPPRRDDREEGFGKERGGFRRDRDDSPRGGRDRDRRSFGDRGGRRK